MKQDNNKELAHIFEEMALLYEVTSDRFRSRAYHRGAQTLETLAEDVGDIYRAKGIGGLDGLPGIGMGMAKKIEEYITSGHIKEYTDLKKKMPVDMEALTSVEGLGPKMAATLYKELGIKTLEDLEKAARRHTIQKLEGFGEKTEENILQGISFIKASGGRMLLGDVLPYARKLIAELEEIPGIDKVSEAGSLRRRQETIGDVDILISARDSKEVFNYIEKLPGVVKTLGRGDTKISVHLKRGLPTGRQGFDIDVRVIAPESWGAALQYFTGSKEHNVALRQIAIKQKYKLNEYGLFRGKRNVAEGKDEAFIYKKLGLDYIEPELRTDAGEFEAALRRVQGKPARLPDLIDYGDLKGDLQIQTNWTDGKHSIDEMAHEAKRLGHEYIAVTDHTKSLAMTGGSDEKRLLKQLEEIKKLNKKIDGITILAGAEVNILKDGTLDIDDEVLARLDVVGISVHSHFNLPREEMTRRILRAMENPHADILFHPTGRRIHKRPAYDVDMEAVIRHAKKTGTILEINAFPSRLDLKDEHIRMAVRAGVKMCIDTDAHAKEHLQYLEYGISQARRGWAEKKDVINTLPLKQFLASLKGGRK